MKIIPILLVATLGWLTGCTIEQPYKLPATVEPTITSAPAPAQSYADENLFVNAIKAVHNGPVYISDSELLLTGWGVCEAAESGVSATAMMQAVASSATDADTYSLLTEITFAALMFLCPEYEYLVDQMTTV